jgi:hypothetical protein
MEQKPMTTDTGKRKPAAQSGHPSLAAALVAAQAKFPPISRDATGQVGTSRKYKYATLATTLEAVLAPLNAEGICVTQPTMTNESGRMVLVTVLTHAGTGETMEGTIPLPVPDNWQSWGSALTYARRYGLTALLGVSPEDEDDDGAQAQGFTRAPQAKPAGDSEDASLFKDPGATHAAIEQARKHLASARSALRAAVENNGFEASQVQDLLVNAAAFAPETALVQFDQDGRINVNKLDADALDALAKVIEEHVDELKANLGAADHLPAAVETDG